MTYDIDNVTPRPWVAKRNEIASGKTIIAEVTGAPSNPSSSADARHIVHCVNHHEQLVSCLEWALGKAAEGMASPDPEYDRARALLDKVRY